MAKISVSKNKTVNSSTKKASSNRIATIEEAMLGADVPGKKDLILLKPFVIRKAIRSNISDEDLCREYNCTHTELEGKIMALYPYDGGEIISDLKRNGKFKSSSSKKSTKTPPAKSGKSTTPPPEDPVSKAIESILDYDTEMLPKSLTGLQDQKQIIEEWLTVVNKATSENATKIKDKNGEIKELESKITRIKRSLEEKQAELEKVKEEKEKLDNTDRSYIPARKTAEEIIKKIEGEIVKANRPAMFIYLDGSIELDKDHENLALDDTGFEEIRKKIIYDDLITDTDISVKSIRLVSRIVQIIKNRNGEIDFEFEDEKLNKEVESLLVSLK